MADKKLTVTITGDTKNVEGALSRLAGVAGDAGGKIKDHLGGALAVFGGNLMTKAAEGVMSFVAGSVAAAEQSAKVARETERVIRTTGGAANVSAGQVGDLANSLSNLTGIDDEAIQGAENLLLTFTGVRNEVGQGNDVFTQASKLALDMSTALGTDASGAAIQLGKALNDPIKGITALARAGVSFTEQQKAQIKTLVESGDTLGAQKVILAELSKEFGGAAATAATPLEKLRVVIDNVQEKVGGFFLPAIGAAADFLGERLPAAADAAGEALDGMIASAAPVVRDVFGRLAEAGATIGENLGSAFADIGRVVVDLARAAAPVAGYFAAIAGTVIVAGLVALSGALREVASFLSDNLGLVRLLASVGFVALAVQVTATAVAFAEMAKAQLLIKAMDLSATIRSMVDTFAAARAGGAGMTEALGSASSAMAGLGAASIVATAGIAAIGLILWKVQDLESQGAKEAENFRSALETKIDTTTYSGMQQELEGLRSKMAEVGRYGGTIGERLNIFKMAQMEGDYNKYKDMVAEAEEKVKQAGAVFDETARAIQASGPASMQGAAGFDQIRKSVVAVQEAGHIDPVAPGAVEKLQAATVAALNTDPAVAGMAKSVAVMADASSTATERVDAFKSALDSLFGIQLSLWDTTTKVSESFDALANAALKGANMFELGTGATAAQNAEIEKNRSLLSSQIAAISQQTQAVYQDALTHGTQTEALNAASNALAGHRAHLLDVMTQLLGNKGAAEQYINQLNLTPENISTLINLNPQNAPQVLGGVQFQMNDIRDGAHATVSVDAGQAMMALSGVEARLSAINNRVVMARVQAAPMQMPLAHGGIVEFFAQGGRHENHVAQIATGTTRVWNEPETHGEAYIPLALSKRTRSLSILAQVAERFGLGLTDATERRQTSEAVSVRAAHGAPPPSTTSVGGGVTVVLQVEGALVHTERDLGRYLAGALQAHLDSGGRVPTLSQSR